MPVDRSTNAAGPTGPEQTGVPPEAGQTGLGQAGAGHPGAGSAPGAGGPAMEGIPASGGLEARLAAAAAAARYHGVELDTKDFRATAGEVTPSAATLTGWLREQGLVARAVQMRWRHLFRFHDTPPVVLLFNDGTAGLLVGADAQRAVVWLKDPRGAQSDPPVAVDQLRLSQVWTGEVIMVRRGRGGTQTEAPFNLKWIAGLVGQERTMLRDIAITSMILSVLTIVPPLVVMMVVDRVVSHHSISTLVLLSLMIGVMTFYETMLGWSRRELVGVLATRLDTKLNLHLFSRLLALPVDFFEHHPAGETTSRLAQIFKVRDFLTTKLMGTFLDAFTLVVLLPFLFWMDTTLAWMVLVAAGLISLIIVIFMRPVGRLVARMVAAENAKGAVLVETVSGMRTVKTLALEPARKAEWDERVADASSVRLALTRLSNWPQTMITPIEAFISRGVILIGAYLAIQDTSGLAVGALVAFMMLGARVAAPLVGVARLMDDMNDVRASVWEVGQVLNQETETRALTTGMRPRLAGALSFEELMFTYPRAKVPALNNVTFEVPAGTMLGLVGRSGSGKSTITRLLQGINREYSGYLKIDGVELREINLTHLRRNLGIVLQDNFLFRGTVRDNITAGRPGPHARGRGARRPPGRRRGVHRAPAAGLRDLDRGGLGQHLGRPAPAPRDRARRDLGPAHHDPGRGHLGARPGERGAGERQPPAHRQGPHDGDRVPPPVLAGGLPLHRGDGSRQADRHRAARRAAGALLDLPAALDAAEPPPQPRGRPQQQRHHPGAGAGRRLGRQEASSFSEEKEAKRLAPEVRCSSQHRAMGQKFFGSFFQKRTAVLPSF